MMHSSEYAITKHGIECKGTLVLRGGAVNTTPWLECETCNRVIKFEENHWVLRRKR